MSRNDALLRGMSDGVVGIALDAPRIHQFAARILTSKRPGASALRPPITRNSESSSNGKEAGARAILILEEDDIQSTNHFEASVSERPDEVYLFSTAASRWFAVRLRIGGTLMEDMELEERYWETGPDRLNVTGSG
jgi:hypothetical protein